MTLRLSKACMHVIVRVHTFELVDVGHNYIHFVVP